MTAYNEVRATPKQTPSAGDVNYDNTSSGLSASNVQDALDEITQVVEYTLERNTTYTQSMNAHCIKYGRICFVDLDNCVLSSSVTGTYTEYTIAYGAPEPVTMPVSGNVRSPVSDAINVDGQKAEGFLHIDSAGRLKVRVRSASLASKTILGSIVYITKT